MCFVTVLLHKMLMAVDDIMSSILPKDKQEEIPVGFSIVGHVGTSVLT